MSRLAARLSGVKKAAFAAAFTTYFYSTNSALSLRQLLEVFISSRMN